MHPGRTVPLTSGEKIAALGPLQSIARRHTATPAQIALAWVLHRDGVIPIPRAGTPAHVRLNAAARDIELAREDLDTLDRSFPPPARPRQLEVL